jgi:flagellar hook-associated protein 3 FlgL
MDHISTAGMYQSALLNLFTAQSRQNDAAAQIATGKVATDLKGYASDAEKLTATRSLYARTQSYIENGKTLSNRLSMQDTALVQLGKASQDARNAVANALATGDASPLMSTLQNEMMSAGDALNTQFQGRYLFAGGQTNTAPFNATTLPELTAAPSVASLFQNDQLGATNRIDDNTVVNTGFQADAVGAPLMQALKAVQAFSQGASGPLNGKLTTAQQDFLQSMLAQFDSASAGITTVTAQNGLLQNKVTATQATLQDRQAALEGAIGDLTNADMAQAASNLQLAQVAVAASAQVFSRLQGSSLLNVLSTSR